MFSDHPVPDEHQRCGAHGRRPGADARLDRDEREQLAEALRSERAREPGDEQHLSDRLREQPGEHAPDEAEEVNERQDQRDVTSALTT